MSNYSSSKNFKNGYPTPGPQNPDVNQILNHVYFTNNEEWKKIREENTYDYVVVGTGFCAYAFVERVLKGNPNARILMLERGGFHLPEHFQNLPLAYQGLLGGMSETFPWSLDYNTANKDTSKGDFIKSQHGMLPFFGGRSTTWSAWCPRPNREELALWNEDIVKRLEAKGGYFESAEQLLNVIGADKLVGKSSAYGKLQKSVSVYFDVKNNRAIKNLTNLSRVMPAPLAANGEESSEDFHKFSTPEKILELKMMIDARKDAKGVLDIVTLCTVNKIINDGSKAYALDTSRGILNLKEAKLILAMGTLPPTTLMRNSYPALEKVGTRFTSHFITSVVARIKRSEFLPLNMLNLPVFEQTNLKDSNKAQFAAMYVAGVEKKLNSKDVGQFHIQMTFIEQEKQDDESVGLKNRLAALKHMPDVVATASEAQLKGGEDYITIVCAVLGELDYQNKKNRFVSNPVDSDITTNSLLSVEASKDDLKVWDAMDQFTFDVLEKVLSMPNGSGVEYWSNNSYRDTRPEVGNRRVDGMVHEASTMWIDKNEKEGVVGTDYRPIGVENVYITGGSLWPSGGSWNPTMTMVAMTQDLADQLLKNKK